VQSDTQFESAKQDGYIKIHVKSYSQNRYEPKANATGCSLGVDSFSSILHHIDKSCLEGYRLTHLTYFNVGAHGTKDLKGTEESFFHDLKTIQKFGEEIGLPVVWVNTNLQVLYQDFTFNQSHTFENPSVVLALQKLFKRYFYASGCTFLDYNLKELLESFVYLEDPILARISTECTSLMSDDYDLSRTDKTRYIANHPITYKNLYVCLKEQISNDNGDDIIASIKDKTRNCSRCEKCMRTLLTLDIIHATKQYESIFDLRYFEKAKKFYIGKVLAYRKSDSYYSDIYGLMKKEKYDIPLYSKVFAPFYRLFKLLAPEKLYSKFLRKYRQQ